MSFLLISSTRIRDMEAGVFFQSLQDPDGGYGGGPGQLPHLATTDAALNSLITLGSDKAKHQRKCGVNGGEASVLEKKVWYRPTHIEDLEKPHPT